MSTTVEHRGAVCGKNELLTALWPEVTVENNNPGQAVSKLRQVLGEACPFGLTVFC